MTADFKKIPTDLIRTGTLRLTKGIAKIYLFKNNKNINICFNKYFIEVAGIKNTRYVNFLYCKKRKAIMFEFLKENKLGCSLLSTDPKERKQAAITNLFTYFKIPFEKSAIFVPVQDKKTGNWLIYV